MNRKPKKLRSQHNRHGETSVNLLLVVVTRYLQIKPWDIECVADQQGNSHKYHFHSFEYLLPYQWYFYVPVEVCAWVYEPYEIFTEFV